MTDPAQLPGHRLLPPQTTALERAVADVAPAWDAFAGITANIETARPVVYKPWLAAEWHLAQFAPLFADLDALFAEGLPWLLERGTVASVRRALSWLGYGDVLIEEDGAYLHIDPGAIVDDAAIAAMRRVVVASLPAHVRFYRVFHDYDLRPIRLDHGPALDAGMLDNDSGVWVDDTKSSFLRRFAFAFGIEADAPIHSGQLRAYANAIHDDNSWRLDAWALDSEIELDAAGRAQELVAFALPDEDLPAQGAYLEERAAEPVTPDESDLLPLVHVLFTDAASVLPQTMARWGGPWGGPWREAIPSRYSESS